MFIVIEGDNGTGKTSVSTILNKEHGFEFITEHPDISELEKNAKTFKTGSRERFEAFLGYNLACGKRSEQFSKAILARYWISTIAAGYADKLFDIDEAMEKAYALRCSMPCPDHIFRLKCSFEKRVERIENRALINGNDDISAERNMRYTFILDRLQQEFSLFHEIDTDNTEPVNVADIILNIIGGEK